MSMRHGTSVPISILTSDIILQAMKSQCRPTHEHLADVEGFRPGLLLRFG